MWKIVDDYLLAVAAASGRQRDHLVLVRGSGKDEVVITPKNIYDDYLKPDYGYGARLMFYRVVDVMTREILTSWGLYEFPSCCAFCVSTQAYVEQAFRGRGINKLSNTFRQAIAKNYDYSALICTDIESNVAERKTLMANGFTDIYQIQNKRTGNLVSISVKAL